MKHIAILASGTGSNARRLIRYFRHHPGASVTLVLSNRPQAPVLEMARREGVESRVLERPVFYESRYWLDELRRADIHLLVLAGFLWMIPPYLVEAYEGRMVNIHPALLPAFGGKGMYGMNVHRAVKEAGERETGITIHWVNRQYDEGRILYQASCTLDPSDSAEDIAKRVQRLEHRYFPLVVEQLLTQIPNP